MEKLTCIDDFEEIAKSRLDPAVRRFYYDGSEQEITLRRNRSGFQNFLIKPKNLLSSVENVSLETSLLGGRVKMGMPIGISPTALHKLAHSDGEIGTAKACASAGSVMTMSSWSNTRLDVLAQQFHDTKNLWMNTYIFTDRSKTLEHAKLAERLGCGALVVSCDISILSRRRYGRDPQIMKRVFDLVDNCWCPHVPRATVDDYAAGDPSSTWKDLEDVSRMTGLPLVAKGITTAHDARKAVEHGASAIWVSTHGGRQLDGIPGSIEVLPDVVGEVGREVDVYIDSGFRTGTDVFKALCLGAKAAFLGRPILSGLACGGSDGVAKVLQILHDELRSTTALTGCADVQRLDRSFLWDPGSSKI